MKKISRRTAVLVGIPLGLLLAGGIAFAIVVLTTVISGTTGFIDSTASARVASAIGTKSSADCSNITADGSSVTINPLVSRTLVEGKTAEVLPGNCTVTIRLENTGQVALTSSRWVSEKTPTGWSITQPFSSAVTINPGQSASIQLSVTADSTAAAGTIAGRIVSAT
ncbi:NEW3 domain-containing protein [Pseudonocardia sp. DR1-2]|uniref:NEW3 domain-containing protein n=1 Tax=Pseudonocardia sp. DR1-2 TaxID=2951168 RepID=UPI0020433344|nr:NEW3 domain-containing protein [Pseudonocardia sp. DR1-2]MCM3850002.1 NEW3 domain-containing protein [Pseudonocardia sp. DR1-2]